MSSNSLDNLAISGVINFDADAFIKGTAPRFVGNPEGELYLPLNKPLYCVDSPFGIAPGPLLQGAPVADAFANKKGIERETIPTWKQAAAVILLAGVGIFATIKGKSAISSIYKKITSTPAADVAGNSAGTDAATATATAAKGRLASLKLKISDFGTSSINRVKNLSKSSKIVLGSVAGVLGLYGIYKTFITNKQPQSTVN